LLDCLLLDMARQISILEEKHSQGQAELVQRCSDFEEKTLNSTLRAQLDSEKVTYETVPCIAVFLLLA
jgi:hypothetical protein